VCELDSFQTCNIDLYMFCNSEPGSCCPASPVLTQAAGHMARNQLPKCNRPAYTLCRVACSRKNQ
jgi:hypothetical protein